MSVAKEFEEANAQYAAKFDKGGLALPPARAVTVITCMDARIEPAGALGIKEGDAHVSPTSIVLTGTGDSQCRWGCQRGPSVGDY